MGRHRREVAERDRRLQEIIEDRLGNNSLVCTKCNASNPQRADKCRRCGHTQLRHKASEYRDG